MPNALSPTGVVHAIEYDYSEDPDVAPEWKDMIITKCHYADAPGWSAIGRYDLPWPKTHKPVTCKRCLLAIQREKLRNVSEFFENLKENDVVG